MLTGLGANRPDAKVSRGLRDSFWLQGVQAGFKAVVDCIQAFSETDFKEDLKKFDVPTLILHGDDDQIVPICGPGETTAVIVDVTKDRITGASVGDSRAWIVHDGTVDDLGLGVRRDAATARGWYEAGASHGSVAGMYNLALMYERGEGGTRNLPKAIEWYRKAADLGDEEAKKRLSELQ